jgi:steroid delta-isomerase-like uncharacterized protein
MNTLSDIKTGQALLDAFNTRDLDTWQAKLADTFTASYPGMREISNKDVARAYNGPFLQAFSDLSMQVTQVIADGDAVVYKWIGSGTHDGSLATPSGAIPPTGRKAAIPGVLVTTIKDGKITREETYWNQVELMAQLGLM